MSANWHIDSLGELFYILFRPAQGEDPVIKGQQRLVREDYFRLFFPEELCAQYLGKTKSNLTWFFNNDSKNKAIKRSLIRMMEPDCRGIVNSTHQKCKAFLWPQGQHAAFDRQGLWQALSSIRIRGALNAKYGITVQTADGNPARLRSFFDADPSAALARVILTLAVASDAPDEMVGSIWSTDSSNSGYDFLSGDSSVEGRIRYGSMLYLDGKREQAFAVFEHLAKKLKRPAANAEESAMYCRMGLMLVTGDGHYRDEAAALDCFRLGCIDSDPEAYYLLARYSRGSEALEALEKAADMGHTAALRELGNACFAGSERLGCPQDVERSRRIFCKAMAVPGEDGAYCAYMTGRFYEAEGQLPAALSAYRIARENGSAEAAARLARLNWLEPEPADEQNEKEPELAQTPKYCFMNSDEGRCRTFADSIRGAFKLSVSPSPARELSRMAQELIFSAEIIPQMNFALLSDDRADNLRQAVSLLAALQSIARRLGSRKWELVEQVDIYVLAEHDHAAMLLDSAFAGMGELYFRLRLCDSAVDAAQHLFAEAPLFLPCLRSGGAEALRMVILGSSDAAMAALRQALALPLPAEQNAGITIFCPDSERMRADFEAACPGVYSAAPALRRILPRFESCELSPGSISRAIRCASAARRDEGQASDASLSPLALGNYYIVATEDEALNIRLAALLRSELLKADPSFTNLPFIAVYVRDPLSSRLVGNISAESGTGHSWHSHYDLHCFGGAELYSFAALKNDLTERRALAIHAGYAGSDSHEAMASYYQRQHNRDSSRAMAAHLPYRAFAAGICLPNWKMYGSGREEASLAPAYGIWLEQQENLERAAKLEHERWNCFMLSAGWEQASASQVATYVQRGNPGQQLYLAKLHPFICPWEELRSGSLLQQVEEAIHSRLPEKKVHDPRIADAQAVKQTAQLLSVF